MSLQSVLLRCPGCGTVFRGPASVPAHGRVRCGVCSEVFAAQADVAPLPSGRAGHAADIPRPAYVSAVAAATPAAGLLPALVVVLLVMLAGQMLWLGRNRAAELPALRPLLEAACQRLGCSLPPFRDLRAIRVTEARVTSHPDYAGALLAVVRLENGAPLAQPWPRLALALTGPADAVVAERMFEPAEYLPAEQQGNPQFVAGATVEVRLPLADPGMAAAGFRFTLH
ncbi:zinc-ribbon and DUF3426 domain-containing protein [Immundisolibacter sp.]|uniref:zinc-ribbon and DUF3426 domain-containing protein n=1 Tax=Immundisolibacter sp. TaxID=1934948 RepID=UPI002B15C369|nr:zinc-ribbon and DUF3426 domain-containing protein [Immundisolibacter sp.]MEA3219452.1 hypothetical protein [Immundisolibacter sp.]